MREFNNSHWEALLAQGKEGFSENLKEALKGILRVKLKGIVLNSQQVKALAEALKDNKSVTGLMLVEIAIGNEGAARIAEVLKVNKTLNALTLVDNKIESEGAKYISEALKTNETLAYLCLFQNLINSIGAKYISEALKINKILAFLDLSYNPIGNQGAKYLIKALKDNDSVISCNLYGFYIVKPEVPISKELLDEIDDLSKRNYKVFKLNCKAAKEGNFQGWNLEKLKRFEAALISKIKEFSSPIFQDTYKKYYKGILKIVREYHRKNFSRLQGIAKELNNDAVLPVEMLQHIFSFLKPGDVKHNLSTTPWYNNYTVYSLGIAAALAVSVAVLWQCGAFTAIYSMMPTVIQIPQSITTAAVNRLNVSAGVGLAI